MLTRHPVSIDRAVVDVRRRTSGCTFDERRIDRAARETACTHRERDRIVGIGDRRVPTEALQTAVVGAPLVPPHAVDRRGKHRIRQLLQVFGGEGIEAQGTAPIVENAVHIHGIGRLEVDTAGDLRRDVHRLCLFDDQRHAVFDDALERITELRVAQEAQVERSGDRRDQSLHVDVPVVHGGTQPRNEGRLNHHPHPGGVRFFRLQIEVTGGLHIDRDDRVVIERIDAIALEAGRLAGEKLRQVRCTDVARPCRAEPQVVDRRPGQPGLPRGDIARRAVARRAGTGVEIEDLRPLRVLGERDDGFHEAFGHVVAAVGSHIVPIQEACRRGGRTVDLLDPVFNPERERNRSGPVFERLAVHFRRRDVLNIVFVALVEQQNVIERRLGIHADTEGVVGRALISPRIGRVGIVQTRAADDGAVGSSHRIKRAVVVGKERHAFVPRRLTRNPGPEVKVPVPGRVEGVHLAGHADRIAVRDTVIDQLGSAIIEIGVAGAEPEGRHTQRGRARRDFRGKERIVSAEGQISRK